MGSVMAEEEAVGPDLPQEAPGGEREEEDQVEEEDQEAQGEPPEPEPEPEPDSGGGGLGGRTSGTSAGGG